MSGLRHMYPVADKSAAEQVRCISHFQGRRQIKVLYSDNSGELGASCRALEILPCNSVPGIPQSNSIAERLVQDCLEGRGRYCCTLGCQLAFGRSQANATL